MGRKLPYSPAISLRKIYTLTSVIAQRTMRAPSLKELLDGPLS